MASSCNVAFANLGLMIGPKVVMDELQRFGFDHVSEDGLILGKVVDQPEKKIETADLSIGLEHTQCTPLHGALIASVFANGGFRVEPTLFSARDGLLGISKQQDLEVQKERILPEEWLEPLQQSMLAVVNWGGTAHGIVPNDFPVAMKTGTAATPGLGYHTNYIGFGPVEDVKIAFCVRITRIRSSKTAGQASRGATGRLLRYLAKNSELLNSHSTDELMPWTVAFEADDE
jgi:cell division protein FtsI/penicillin-binding protein 2